jgi:hypothetical protein
MEKILMLSLSKHESGAALDGPGKPGHDTRVKSALHWYGYSLELYKTK